MVCLIQVIIITGRMFMAVAVIMPRQGNTVESCIITNWNKKPGDTVAVGDILFSYETDKSTFDEPAQLSGTMLAILVNEGAKFTLAVIGESEVAVIYTVSEKGIHPSHKEELPIIKPLRKVKLGRIGVASLLTINK